MTADPAASSAHQIATRAIGGQGTPNFIANTQSIKTISAEQISQPETDVVGDPAAVVIYLQRRFGLSAPDACTIGELALFAAVLPR